MQSLEDLNGKVAAAWAIINNDPPYKIPAYAKSISYSASKILLEFDCTNLPELDAIASGQHFVYKPVHTLVDQLTVSLSHKDNEFAVGTAYCRIDNRFTIAKEQPDMVAYLTGTGNNAIVIHSPKTPCLKWDDKKIYAPLKHLHKMITLIRVKLEYKDVCLIDPTRKLNPITVYSIVADSGKQYIASVTGDVQPKHFDVSSKTRILHIVGLRDFVLRTTN